MSTDVKRHVQTRGPFHREKDLRRILGVLGMFTAFAGFFLHPRPFSGGGEQIAVADSLVQHGVFGNPFIATLATGPTAHLAPFQPFFLALLSIIFGKFASAAATFCVCAAQGIHAALLPRVARFILGRSLPGVIGSAIAILLPIFSVVPAWESMYSALAAMAFCVFVQRVETARQAILSGLLAGAILLLNPALAIFMACWIGYRFWLSATGIPAMARFLLVLGASALLVILPWEVRNARALGSPAFIRDNLGLELYISNSDCARKNLLLNIETGCHELMHPIGSPEEAGAVLKMGEIAYNRDRMGRAMNWIRKHPRAFWNLTGQRFIEYWFPEGWPAIGLATILAFLGLAGLVAGRKPEAPFFLATLAICPLLYYFVEGDGRYRQPLMWVTLLLAGVALESGIARVGPRVPGLGGILYKSTFPPEITTPTLLNPGGNFPNSTAAADTAPLGSTTSFMRSIRNRIASRISSSVTNKISSTNFCIIGNVSLPGEGDRNPSAIVSGGGIVTRSPFRIDCQVSLANSGSAPKTRIPG